MEPARQCESAPISFIPQIGLSRRAVTTDPIKRLALCSRTDGQFAFASVSVQDGMRAITALNGTRLHGTPIVVEYEQDRERRGFRVYVGNLPFDFTRQSLTESLASVGIAQAENMSLHRTMREGVPAQFAFFSAANQIDVESAVQRLDGTNIGGNTVRVERCLIERTELDRRRERERAPELDRQQVESRWVAGWDGFGQGDGTTSTRHPSSSSSSAPRKRRRSSSRSPSSRQLSPPRHSDSPGTATIDSSYPHRRHRRTHSRSRDSSSKHTRQPRSHSPDRDHRRSRRDESRGGERKRLRPEPESDSLRPRQISVEKPVLCGSLWLIPSKRAPVLNRRRTQCRCQSKVRSLQGSDSAVLLMHARTCTTVDSYPARPPLVPSNDLRRIARDRSRSHSLSTTSLPQPPSAHSLEYPPRTARSSSGSFSRRRQARARSTTWTCSSASTSSRGRAASLRHRRGERRGSRSQMLAAGEDQA